MILKICVCDSSAGTHVFIDQTIICSGKPGAFEIFEKIHKLLQFAFHLRIPFETFQKDTLKTNRYLGT